MDVDIENNNNIKFNKVNDESKKKIIKKKQKLVN